MNHELEETLRFIIDRSGEKRSVFIPTTDFPWRYGPDNQLTKLQKRGYIKRPRFYDNGAEIMLTANGSYYFENKPK